MYIVDIYVHLPLWVNMCPLFGKSTWEAMAGQFSLTLGEKRSCWMLLYMATLNIDFMLSSLVHSCKLSRRREQLTLHHRRFVVIRIQQEMSI